MTYGIFGHYLLNMAMKSIRGLPPIPRGYTLCKVNSDTDVNIVLNLMRIRSTEIDIKYPEESSGNKIIIEGSAYDDECFFVMLWFTNIFDYWFGKKQVKYISTPSMDACFDDLCMNIWRWIKNEISTNELKNITEKFYREAIKYV